jgi:hypothetical protein
VIIEELDQVWGCYSETVTLAQNTHHVSLSYILDVLVQKSPLIRGSTYKVIDLKLLKI